MSTLVQVHDPLPFSHWISQLMNYPHFVGFVELIRPLFLAMKTETDNTYITRCLSTM